MKLVTTGRPFHFHVVVDAEQGVLQAQVEESEWNRRVADEPTVRDSDEGLGRELFAGFRAITTPAEEGAVSLGSWPASASTASDLASS